MDAARFDAIAKAEGAEASRRQVLSGLAGGALAAMLARLGLRAAPTCGEVGAPCAGRCCGPTGAACTFGWNGCGGGRRDGLCGVSSRDTCAVDAECCTRRCRDGACVACLTTGATCVADANCCSGPCCDGVCACRRLGEACGSSSNCCEGVCAGGRCCRPLGGTGSVGGECCGGRCAGNACACVPADGACGRNAPCCGGLCSHGRCV